jgi:hypothetical protein
MKTRKNKIELGGDIHNRKIFENILSIGYELETSSLSKLTLISEKTEKGESILLNTDTARKDLEKFKEVGDESEEDEDFVLRQEEIVEMDAFDKNGKKDKNVSFLITNDIVESPFVRFLNKNCEEIEEEEQTDLEKIEFKNQLYSFLDEKQNKYNFEFIFHDEKTPCSVFSDVEWIFTYYKPKSSGNIILDTFANSIYNILHHIYDLRPVNGKFKINICNKKKIEGGESSKISKNAENSIKTCEIIANKPENRILYHKPGTNLYYLQTHYYEKKSGEAFSMKDVCITPQMTFSANISNIIPIMKQMINDSIKSIPTANEVLERQYQLLNNIEYVINLLFTEHNEKNKESGFVFVASFKKEEYKAIKSYLFLIFYKLFMFYNVFNNNTKVKYFKDSLFFNSRHSNYILYEALKKSIHHYFKEKWNTKDSEIEIQEKIIQIIQILCVQTSILEQHFITDSNKRRKNVFNLNNKLDKNSSSYGNPGKSLISYFEFFENPIDNDTNIDDEDNIVYYDYLEYKRIDAYSAKMDLNSDIVLIEYRGFARSLSTYIYSILDPLSKEKMTHGICNEMTKNYQADIRGISISVLSDFYIKYSRENSFKSKSKSNKSKKSMTKIKRLHVS